MNAAVVPFPALDLSAEIETFDLSALYLSELNPRQITDPEQDALLAKSLVACGLVQNLVGIRDNEGKVGIVAGGRRLRALKIAVAERPDLAQVKVMLAPDAETAAQWAVAENVARLDMDPADEIAAYARMQGGGASVAQIASAFAVTEPHVYRRLKLASLPECVLDALKERKINFSQASAFTISDDLETITRVLEVAIRRSLAADSIRNELKSSAVAGDSRKALYVGEDAYRAAGGILTRDLFGEDGETYFDCPDILNALFGEKVQARADEIAGQGWAWTMPVEESYFNSWEHPFTRIYLKPQGLTDDQRARKEELAGLGVAISAEQKDELGALLVLESKREATPAEKAVSGVVVYVDQRGELSIEGPYIRPSEAQAAMESGVIDRLDEKTRASVADKPKPIFSQSVKDDLRAIQLHAFQSKLRQNPKLAMTLLAFSLSDASGPDSIFGLRVEAPVNAPSITDGLKVDDAICFPASRPDKVGNLETAFAEFSQQDEDTILSTLVASAVRTIHTNLGYSGSGKGLFGSLLKALDVNEREIWEPRKAAFWARMPSSYIDSKFTTLTGFGEDSAEFQAFSKKKKGDKADEMDRLFTDPEFQAGLKLSKKRIEKINAWMPDPEE